MHARRAKLIRRATTLFLKWKGIDPFSPDGSRVHTTLYRRAKKQWAREKVIAFEDLFWSLRSQREDGMDVKNPWHHERDDGDDGRDEYTSAAYDDIHGTENINVERLRYNLQKRDVDLRNKAFVSISWRVLDLSDAVKWLAASVVLGAAMIAAAIVFGP